MASTTKPKQVRHKSVLRGNASSAKKNVSTPKNIPARLKKPGRGLADLIDRVNLVPREVELPDLEPSLMLKENEPALLVFIERLPEKLRTHLIKIYQQDPFAPIRALGNWG